MGVSQRLQSLIFYNRFAAAKSLHCVDLTRQLFGNTATSLPIVGDGSESAVVEAPTSQTLGADSCYQKNEQAAAAALQMERIQLPCPDFTFQAAPNEPYKIDCFPFVDRKMLWADHLGHSFLFDAEMHQMDIMPCLHKPKLMPISLFVPNADADSDYVHHRPGSSLFVMERFPRLEVNWSTQWDCQLEALVYCKPTMTSDTKYWQWKLLQPPPYIREPKYCNSCSHLEISSYAVISIGSDSHICISVKGVGTYCLDTANHTWRKVGNWMLPFHGRVEYVPELKLWFGFTSEARHLAAADLSALDSQPQLVGTWKEVYLPEEWKECRDSQLVNLGSGRFCILRFFKTRIISSDSGSDIDQNVAVFTGVEVVPRLQDANDNNEKLELQMIPHKSLCHKSNGITIDAVF